MGTGQSHDMSEGGHRTGKQRPRCGDWLVLGATYQLCIAIDPEAATAATCGVLSGGSAGTQPTVSSTGKTKQTESSTSPSPLVVAVRIDQQAPVVITNNVPTTCIIRWQGYSILIWPSPPKPHRIHSKKYQVAVFTPQQHIFVSDVGESIQADCPWKLQSGHIAVLSDALIVSTPHQLAAAFLPFTEPCQTFDKEGAGGPLEIWRYQLSTFSMSPSIPPPALPLEGGRVQSMAHDITVAAGVISGESVIRVRALTDLRFTGSLLRESLPRVLLFPVMPSPKLGATSHTKTPSLTRAPSLSTTTNTVTEPAKGGTRRKSGESIIPKLIQAYAETTPTYAATHGQSFKEMLEAGEGVALIDDLLEDGNERVWLNLRNGQIWLRTREVRDSTCGPGRTEVNCFIPA